VPGPKLTPYGERGLLVEVDGLDEVAMWAAAIRGAAIPGVVDVVPAAKSVLLHLAAELTPPRAARLVSGLDPQPVQGDEDSAPVEIPVTYDGPDLAEVSRQTGLAPAQVVRAHLDSRWRVGFAGFVPGFAYLVGGDPRLAVSRRPSPRTRVPGGSVGLAAGYSAVYPRASPGGWQLIARTDLELWEIQREPPTLLLPGRAVRFVEAGA
jgi:KipI family sensor histidine kinase inhibitor